MPARKMRVEVFDENGNRYAITFQGNVTRDKALRLLDVVELLGGMPGLTADSYEAPSNLSKFSEIQLLVERSFPIVWFSSKDVKSVYEQEFKKPINLSTVSTYLSRMTERGILSDRKLSNHKVYRKMTNISRKALNVVKQDRSSSHNKNPRPPI
ncbi:MAG: hypothetical protein JSV58_07520 [Candidatus Bathyarchaeota archaeon]|nr:MAG: hypothetical protein JSV58_07520 [Candidatus Bathyarchaeota archaeon]